MSERVVKVEASAGSGKTYRLALEYLSRLFYGYAALEKRSPAGGNSPEFQAGIRRLIGSLLAITFTNKAASEMKERVLAFLRCFAMAGSISSLAPETAEFLEKISARSGCPAARILQVSDALLRAVLGHYSDFNVRTIDSLMAAIIKVTAPDFNLKADFEIRLDMTRELAVAARRYLAEMVEQDWSLVENFLLDFKNTRAVQKWELDREIVEQIQVLFRDALSREDSVRAISDGYIESLKTAVFTGLAGFKKALGELVNLFEQDPESWDRRKINPGLQTGIREFIAESREQHSLKALGDLLKRTFFHRDELADVCGRDPDPGFWSRAEPVFLRYRRTLAGLTASLSRFRLIHYIRFYRRFSQLWSRRRDVVFAAEFSRRLMNRMEQWGKYALPYLYLKLSDRFLHFLIDEFQDTSISQFKALIPLIEEILSSRLHSSLFLVGDRKQSIYRWRGGNPALMESGILEGLIPALANITDRNLNESLDKNWRSGRVLVDFNNRFWNPDQIAGAIEPAALRPGVARNFAGSAQRAAASRRHREGCVDIRIHRTVRDHLPREDANRRVLVQVRDFIREILSRGYRGGEVAILVRKNAWGREIISFLTRNGIPAISDESLYLSSSPLINEVVSFFRFLEYPPDNLHFHIFLRGHLFARILDAKLGKAGLKNLDRELVESGERSFYITFREKYPKVWQTYLAPFFQSVGFLPPYDLLQDLIQRLEIYENFPDSALYFLTLSNMLHDLEQQEIQSLAAFLEDWDQRMESGGEYSIDLPEAGDQVRILTMHKAKGLEFPVVILPLTGDRDPRSSYYFKDGEFYYINREYTRVNRELFEIYREEQEKQYIDQLNLLYVSFTRASDVLFVPVAGRDRRHRWKEAELKEYGGMADTVIHHPLLRDRSPGQNGWIQYRSGTLPEKKPVDRPRGKSLLVASKKTSTAAWQKEFLVFHTRPYIPLEQMTRARRGEAIHRVLERIETVKTSRELMGKIAELTAAEPELNAEDTRRLSSFLTREGVFEFFQWSGRIFNEKSLVIDQEGEYQIRRIDRLLLRDDEFVVIDYKTGEIGKEDVQQVKEYLRAVQQIFPDRKGRGYLWYPDLDRRIEVKC